jgi:hypothetical protein
MSNGDPNWVKNFIWGIPNQDTAVAVTSEELENKLNEPEMEEAA